MPTPERTRNFLQKNIPDSLSDLKKYSRRDFLIYSALSLGSLGVIPASLTYLIKAGEEKKVKHKAIQDELLADLDANCAPVQENEVISAKDEINDFESKVKELAKEGELNKIQLIADPEKIKTAYHIADCEEKRINLNIPFKGNPTPKDTAALLGILVPVFVSYIPIAKLLDKRTERIKFKAIEKSWIEAAVVLHPDWQESFPKKEEIVKFCQALSYLPSIGGKIADPGKGGQKPSPLNPPSLTAEQHCQLITKLRQDKKLPEIYLHQFTIQGRMPDKSKYIAIALILASPYKHNFEMPFYEAPWGKIAPLIHDGGQENININPYWTEVYGRTDFIHRIVETYEPELEDLEKLSSGEAIKLPVDRLENARLEELERDRLYTEAKAYQRWALMFQAYFETAPWHMPDEIKDQLSVLCEATIKELDSLLSEYTIEGVTQVEWFTKIPRKLWKDFPPRHEADYEPIQKELIKLEAIRREHPEIAEKTIGILKKVTSNVDKIIGLSMI